MITDYAESREGACPHTVKAVVVVTDHHAASQVGTTKFVCTNRECETHGQPRHTITPEEKAKRRKELEAQRMQLDYRRGLLEVLFPGTQRPFCAAPRYVPCTLRQRSCYQQRDRKGAKPSF